MDALVKDPKEMDLHEAESEQPGTATTAPPPPAPGGGPGHGGPFDLAEAMEDEEREEAKVTGDGHELVEHAEVALPIDDVDHLSDGQGGSAPSAGGSGGPAESYMEYAGGGQMLAGPNEVAGQLAPQDLVQEDVIERVFGRDDRVRVGNTSAYPWRTICKLEITAANGRVFGCSGSVIGPRTILTNGHCVFMHDNGGWARKIRVIPGKNGAAEPFANAESSHFISVTGWTKDRSSNYDYAVVILPPSKKLGNTVGWMGLASLSFFSLMGLRVNNSGYPGDKPYGTQWWNANNVLAVTDRRVYYHIDTFNGQSGSPVWRFRDGKRHIIAVHNTGGALFNGSVRLSKPVFDNLVKWKNTYT